MPSLMSRSRSYQMYLTLAAAGMCLYLLGKNRASQLETLPPQKVSPWRPVISVHKQLQKLEARSLFGAKDTFEPDPATGTCSGKKWPAGETPLYIITPTYRKAEQLPELTRLGQTLLHVTSLVWIVAEDAPRPTQSVLDYLKRSGLCYVYVRAEMPPDVRAATDDYHWLPRGNTNRNAGIAWIRKTAKKGGVMYLADDDNTYDIRLFEEIRTTKRMSLFPVGLVSHMMMSAPIVKNGKFTGFYDCCPRPFAVDMAGFAINVEQVIKFPDLAIPMVVGTEETKFLEHLQIPPEEAEILAEGATQILVWHTRTEKNAAAADPPPEYDIADSNIYALHAQLWKGNEKPTHGTKAPTPAEEPTKALQAPDAVEKRTEAPAGPKPVENPTTAPTAAKAVVKPTKASAAPKDVEKPTKAPKESAAVEEPTKAPAAPKAVERPTKAPTAPKPVEKPIKDPAAPKDVEKPNKASEAPTAV